MGNDNVNSPNHYTFGKYECIDVIEDVFGKEALKIFCRINAFKYLFRSDHKNGIEDIKKARWYLNKYLELSEDVPDDQSSKSKKSVLMEDLHLEQKEQM